MDRIRVLHLLTFLAPGGAETNLLGLIPHFNHDLFEHIVGFGYGGELEYDFSRMGCRLLKLSSKPIRPQSVFEILSILSKVKSVSPAIVHSHLDGPNVVGLIARFAFETKLVLHFHGLGIIPRRFLPGRNMKHYFWNNAARAYRYCDHAIAICRYQLPFLKALGIDDERVSLVPNGIDLADGCVKRNGDRTEYKFVVVARFFPEKNHELLLRAFHNVVREVPQTQLILVGDGPLRAATEKLARTLKLGDGIIFMGLRRDVPRILSDCDCFVLPSQWELHPITILEAMRAGLPVIASDVGGVSDTVENGVSGLLVKAGDEEDLTRTMMMLASNPKFGRDLGEKGLEIVRKRFSNASVAERIESVYHSILDNTYEMGPRVPSRRYPE